jgi:hypothetical protein
LNVKSYRYLSIRWAYQTKLVARLVYSHLESAVIQSPSLQLHSHILINVAKQKCEYSSFTALFNELLCDLLWIPFLIFKHYWNNSILKRRVSYTAKLFETFDCKNEFIHNWPIMLFSAGLIVNGKLGMMADRKMGNKVLLYFIFLNAYKLAWRLIEAKYFTLLIQIGCTCASTEIRDDHMSIRYPGELIHFLTFFSKSLLVRSDRSPN